jgi:hypothetical protein
MVVIASRYSKGVLGTNIANEVTDPTLSPNGYVQLDSMQFATLPSLQWMT